MAVSGSLFVSSCNNHFSFGLCKISTSLRFFLGKRSWKFCVCVTVSYEQFPGSVDSSKVEHEVQSSAPSHIHLRIQSQDGVIEHFIMRRSTKLKNLLLTYCKTVGIKYKETRFFVDGYFFNHERTPNELGMQDYELIAAMGEQLGGGGGAGAA